MSFEPFRSSHGWNCQASIKRAIDVCGASILMLCLFPVVVVAMFLIAVSMGGPVVFRQERGGYRARIFVLYKLRTMTADRDRIGMPVPAKARSTALGSVLRHLSIDELPQLWNVLKGDMSLIGPRPLLASYLPRYNAVQRRRHEVRPGLTGWAQISGRNALTWEEKLELDVWYVDNWSLLLDLCIALRTLRIVCTGKGSAYEGTPAEYEFMGSPEATSSEPAQVVAR